MQNFCQPKVEIPTSCLLRSYIAAAMFSKAGNRGNPLWNIFVNTSDGSIHKWHHYFNIYHRHFKKYIGKKVNILEIGVDKGGSLAMWRKYFGDGVQVFAVDIVPESKKYEKDGIKIFIGDQADRKFMRKLMRKLPKIDIVIDDGGHTTNQQINTFLECYGKIAGDGVYLVEDLHTNYWPEYRDSEKTFVEFAKEHIDYLNAWFFCGEQATYQKYFSVLGAKPGDCGIDLVPEFTGITHCMCFYNSVIVFEKMPQCPPYSERR